MCAATANSVLYRYGFFGSGFDCNGVHGNVNDRAHDMLFFSVSKAVGTIEFEPGLQGDIPAILDKLIPPSRNYGYEQTWHDGNGHSHLQATLLGPSLTVPIADGKLVLGTWQQIFHLECDVRARKRTVLVTVVGD